MAFTKTLTMSDIESKLVVPNDLFRETIFSPTPLGSGGEAVNFFVRDERGLTWNFRMTCIRAHGSSRQKLVVSAGWLSFVRDRKLRTGDFLSIFRDHNMSGDRMLFRIEVKRRSEKSRVNNNGSHHDDTHEWTRLV